MRILPITDLRFDFDFDFSFRIVLLRVSEVAIKGLYDFSLVIR